MAIKAITETKKARVLVTGAYANGVPLYQERAFIADVRVLEHPKVSAFRYVDVCLVVPVREAEELADAIRLGETEICIENIPPRVGR
jgi:hypothetical protein